MKIEISATISQYRHKHGITQEQLAEAVGVSAAAVSKWETGQSCPDIALLPPLARYFGVTVDELLAYAPNLSDAERDTLIEKVSAVFAQDGWDRGLDLCDRLIHEHPRDMLLRIYLASNMMENLVFAPDDTTRQAGRERQIRWLQEASAATDGSVQMMARNLLGVFYLNAKRLDEAEAILTPLLDTPNSRQLMPTLRMLQGQYDEAARLAQYNLLSTMGDAINGLLTLSSLKAKQEQPRDASQYIDAAEALSRLFKIDNIFRVNIAQSRLNIAAALDDTDGLLNESLAYTNAVRHQNYVIDSPFFDMTQQDGPTAVNPAQDHALTNLIRKNFEENETFDAIRQKPEFQEMLKALG